MVVWLHLVETLWFASIRSVYNLYTADHAPTFNPGHGWYLHSIKRTCDTWLDRAPSRSQRQSGCNRTGVESGSSCLVFVDGLLSLVTFLTGSSQLRSLISLTTGTCFGQAIKPSSAICICMYMYFTNSMIFYYSSHKTLYSEANLVNLISSQ